MRPVGDDDIKLFEIKGKLKTPSGVEISISQEDLKSGSPKIGDMIARNPKNHNDQWLVAQQYFIDNFETIRENETEEKKTRIVPVIIGIQVGSELILVKGQPRKKTESLIKTDSARIVDQILIIQGGAFPAFRCITGSLFQDFSVDKVTSIIGELIEQEIKEPEINNNAMED